MITVQVRGIDAVCKSLRAQSQAVQTNAIGPAINRVVEKARAEIARAIPQEYAVKAAEVRSAITLQKARSGALEAAIEIFGSTKKRGRSLNLIHFLAAFATGGASFATRGARLTQRQLSSIAGQIGFLVKRGAGVKTLPGAFVGNRGRTVFRRVPGSSMASRAAYGGTKHAEAIEPLQVIGFSQMFTSRRINGRIMAKIRADLPIEINRAIARALASGIT